MTRSHVAVLVSFFLYSEGFCSICLFHLLQDKFFTDLNYMIQEVDSTVWDVVAFEPPDLPYATPYHLPPDIVTNRNCYGYTLSTHFGVIVMEFGCREAHATVHSFDIFTRPNGVYVTGTKGQLEVRDFRVVNVLQLTETMVLLISCSKTADTYGVLILNRGTLATGAEEQVDKIVEAKFPASLHHWMNYTVTRASDGKGQCNCTKQLPRMREGEYDKRKGFVLITLIAAAALMGIIKMVKRVF